MRREGLLAVCETTTDSRTSFQFDLALLDDRAGTVTVSDPLADRGRRGRVVALLSDDIAFGSESAPK